MLLHIALCLQCSLPFYCHHQCLRCGVSLCFWPFEQYLSLIANRDSQHMVAMVESPAEFENGSKVQETSVLAKTKRLGKELLQSRAHINNASLLLSVLGASLSESPTAAVSSPKPLLEALQSLEAFFIPLVRSGEFSPSARKKLSEELQGPQGKRGRDGKQKGEESGEKEKAEAIYKSWVWDRYREFVSTLLRFVARHSALPVVQTAALDAIMELVRTEIYGDFNNQLYFKLCSTFVFSKGFNSDLLAVLCSQYFMYLDVSYFTYANMEKIVIRRISRKSTGADFISSDDEEDNGHGGTSVHANVRNMFDILINLPPPSQDSDMKIWSSNVGQEKGDINKTSTSKESAEVPKNCWDNKKQKSRYSKAWLSFLQLPLPVDIYKKVLAQLHRRVIPFLTNPLLLSDFLTTSYNVGGLVSVMALNGLFILITSYGLEYPDFYNKLYALLEPSIFVSKHRARFFELMDTCLKSTHLPSYLAAAFAKKLGRLGLSAPPAGALLVIAMIHNLLRRHPSINCLVHRDFGAITIPEEEASSEGVEESKRGLDPFLASEPDTAKCNALKSSLWEIETLRSHYCPAVSRFVASLETDLTVRAKTTEVSVSDFSSGSYATIFSEEVSKRLKTVPLAFYHTIPTTLFPESPVDDFLGWHFGEKTAAVSKDLVLPRKDEFIGQNGKTDQVTTTQARREDELEDNRVGPLSKKRK